MLPEYFAIVGSIIASAGGLYYLYETITGKSKPNRITWLLWGIFPMITFAAQRSQGVEGLSWATFVAGFLPLVVLSASFANKKAYWKTTKADYYLMMAAVAGIIMWAVTKNANLAIAFTLLADLLAAIPTIIKCYKFPETESWIAYGISAFGFALGMLSIPELTFQNYAFISYLTFLYVALALLSFRRPQSSSLNAQAIEAVDN